MAGLNSSSVRVKLGPSLNTVRHGWMVHLYWRSRVETNDEQPRFSRTELEIGCGAPNLYALLPRNVKRFRGGLVFKAHRLVYHSTLDWRVIKKNLYARASSLISLQVLEGP